MIWYIVELTKAMIGKVNDKAITICYRDSKL